MSLGLTPAYDRKVFATFGDASKGDEKLLKYFESCHLIK